MKSSIRVSGVGYGYDVVIGDIDVGEIRSFMDELDCSGVFCIVDENVWKCYSSELSFFDSVLLVAAGESSKCVGEWERLHSELCSRGADRSSVVVVIGGGVVGDLGGFVASTFMRGIRWCILSTSVVSQVDASIGGKTGIDLPEGKNLVGSFHHPVRVWCVPRYLLSMPERHYRAGMAEAIKYGATLDGPFFDWLLDSVGVLQSRDLDALFRLVETCVRLKAGVVNEDPYERTGRRSVLNFGHTIGHALEQATGYSGPLHGEAVAVGMIVESRVGERMGLTEVGTSDALAKLIGSWGLPVRITDDSLIPVVLESMKLDKKALSGRVALSLPFGIGACRLVPDVDMDVVDWALRV